jgi:peptidoglycan/LPS O-acetylase OafA/YrhL
VLAAARGLGPNFFLFAVSVSFLPIVLIGQIIWAVHTRRVRLPVGVGLGGFAWLLYVWADLLGLGRLDDSYNLALAYAVLLFGIGLMVESRLRPKRWITFLSERSYEIYLLHGVVLFPALDLLVRWMPFGVALPVGLALMMGATELVYRLVDRPGRRLGSLIARRLPGPGGVRSPVPARESAPAPAHIMQR